MSDHQHTYVDGICANCGESDGTPMAGAAPEQHAYRLFEWVKAELTIAHDLIAELTRKLASAHDKVDALVTTLSTPPQAPPPKEPPHETPDPEQTSNPSDA